LVGSDSASIFFDQHTTSVSSAGTPGYNTVKSTERRIAAGAGGATAGDAAGGADSADAAPPTVSPTTAPPVSTLEPPPVSSEQIPVGALGSIAETAAAGSPPIQNEWDGGEG